MSKNLKINLDVNGRSAKIEAEDLDGIRKEIIREVYNTELSVTFSKHAAVMNTAVILGIGINTVYRAIDKKENK